MDSDRIALALQFLDMDFVKKHTAELNKLERSTSNADFAASSEYVSNLMREAGFTDVERTALPCDGTTTFGDCTMPQAWNRTGRCTLEVLSGNVEPSDRMLADTDVEPINAAIWSTPTPEDGVTAELISLKSVESDDWHEVAGKIVLCQDSPVGDMMRKVTLAGAVGLVSYVEDLLESSPDTVRWMNGAGWCGWYRVRDDQGIWNFSITPRRGAMLDEKLAAGEKITLKAIMNTCVADGEIYTVTGRIPGKSSDELAFFAHMYEPFPADNALGVILSVAIGKALKDLTKSGTIPPLEKSVRVVFSMERYGFTEYLADKKRSSRIIAAMNMDGLAHYSYKLAGVLPQLRHSSAAVPFFSEVIIRDYLRKYFPELPFTECAGNLSDDTFGADPIYNVPTGWFYMPAAYKQHHNTGRIFAGVDWELANVIGQVLTAYTLDAALVSRSRNSKGLFKKIVQGIKSDAVSDFKRLADGIKNANINSYAGNIIGDFLVDLHSRRMVAFNKLVAGTVKKSEAKKAVNALRRKYAAASLELDVYELSNSEQRMAYMTVGRDESAGQIMSMIRLPEAERHGFIACPSMLMDALLDGKRNLYEAYTISNFMLKKRSNFMETAGLVSYYKKLAAYGYYSVKYAEALTVEDLQAALQALDVKPTDKMVVHSSYGSLGGVQGGPAAVVKTLIDHCGKKGLLMMPSFNFPYYMGKNEDKFFDIKNTPSCVGVITDEFRKHPDVVRSLNPSHSMAVYGKKNFHWIADHHKTRTMDQNSPLGKLESADGYALMISCPDSVTFMHVVEMTNNVHCLGQRSEEFNTLLPDNRVEKIRTWGWRGGTCQAYNRKAIFDYLRKHNLITEVMVRHSIWQYFKLSDYRKAYEKTVLRGKFGCMQCSVLPRKVANTVVSDWDNTKKCVRSRTSAFTGDWEY